MEGGTRVGCFLPRIHPDPHPEAVVKAESKTIPSKPNADEAARGERDGDGLSGTAVVVAWLRCDLEVEPRRGVEKSKSGSSGGFAWKEGGE